MSGTRILITAAAVLLLKGPAAFAQAVELGANLGRGPFQYADDTTPGTRDVVGVDVCVGCDRRGFFAEYARWSEPGVRSATLARGSRP